MGASLGAVPLRILHGASAAGSEPSPLGRPTRRGERSSMSLADRTIGAALLGIAAVVFAYYTTWTLILVCRR